MSLDGNLNAACFDSSNSNVLLRMHHGTVELNDLLSKRGRH